MHLIGGNLNYSSWTLRPWYLLTEAGIPFEWTRILLDTPNFKSEVAQFAPNGRVPILIDGAITLWESLAICEYVNERHNGKLLPENSEARALARAISSEMHAGFSALRAGLPVNIRARRTVSIDAPIQRDIQRVTELWSDAKTRFGSGGPWLFGAFSIADAMYMLVVSRFHTYGVPLSGPAHDYAQHVLTTDSYQKLERLAAAETEIVEQDEVGTPR